MADRNFSTNSAFKEAVSIDAGRVFDSCCDRDCLEDLRCYFSEADQATINEARSIRVKNAEIANVYIDVEPITFNRGYYSCDMTFFFVIDFDIVTALDAQPTTITGAAYFSKKVILYGSEGNVKIFSNVTTIEDGNDEQLQSATNNPRCVVQCVDPIALSARIGELIEGYCPICHIPESIQRRCGGRLVTEAQIGTPTVYVTLGLFSIVQLIRNVQMVIPVYDFSIPDKQCTDTADQPCDVFNQLEFPTSDFFPPRENRNCGCGSN